MRMMKALLNPRLFSEAQQFAIEAGAAKAAEIYQDRTIVAKAQVSVSHELSGAKVRSFSDPVHAEAWLDGRQKSLPSYVDSVGPWAGPNHRKPREICWNNTSCPGLDLNERSY